MTLAGLLGLAQAAGALYAGGTACTAGLQQRRIAALFLAADASPRTRERFLGLAARDGVPVGFVASQEELGRLTGAARRAVAGIEAGPFAGPAVSLCRQSVRERPIEQS